MASKKPRGYGYVHKKKQQRKRPGRHSKKANKKRLNKHEKRQGKKRRKGRKK